MPLIVSPQHGVLIRTGGQEHLIRARHLTRLPGAGARVIAGAYRHGVTYMHLMFDAHQIVFANGIPAESLYPGPQALGALTPQDRYDLWHLFPCLNPESYGQTARPFRKIKRPRDFANTHAV